MYPNRCEKPNVKYVMALKDSKGKILKKELVSLNYSYGYIQVSNLPKGQYELTVMNFANP